MRVRPGVGVEWLADAIFLAFIVGMLTLIASFYIHASGVAAKYEALCAEHGGVAVTTRSGPDYCIDKDAVLNVEH